MPLNKGLISSKGENVVYSTLEQYSDLVKVIPKINCFDVLHWDTWRNINPTEHNYLQRTHYDFVVCEPEPPYRFLFAVEYDGIGNNRIYGDGNRYWKLNTKKRITEKEGCPVIILGPADLPNMVDIIEAELIKRHKNSGIFG